MDAWLTVETPLVIFPSAGKFSPGRTRQMSPTFRSWIASHSSSEPSALMRRAVLGVILTTASMAASAPIAVRFSMVIEISMKKATAPAVR